MAASTVGVNRPAPRIRAPELRGRGGWLNTAGPLSLVDLRGRFVLVDFWTSCCVNCLHALDELRPVEERFADYLTVVAVHSPKFAHEREHRTVVDAVERYGVTHPVLDDPDLRTWEAYTARAWPTLVLVDPEGYITAEYSGEGHAHAIAAVLEAGIDRYVAAGTLRRGPSPAEIAEPVRTGLRFPGGAVVLPALAATALAATVLVADTAQHALVELAPDPLTGDLTTQLRRIGSGARGLVDGPAAASGFAEPQGLCLLPAPIAARVGYDVVVADTADHALRGVRLSDGAVCTVAGSTASAGIGLSSPWAVAWWRGRVWIALAGTHQLGTFDPLTGEVELVAGTTQEGLRDGELSQAWFAQPSALAVDPVADVLWVLDAESSALRVVCDAPDLPDAPTRLVVRTVVGTGLFDFGHRDGDLGAALFQHPLGIAVEPGGTVLVADTYNGALRRVDPAAGTVRTLLTGLVEPTAVLVGARGPVVVESAAHRLTRVDPDVRARTVDTEPGIVARTPVTLAAGRVRLDVRFVPPPGQHPDERSGPATALRVVATPPALLRAGAGDGTDLLRDLVLDAAVGDGILHVSVRASSCDIEGAEEYPACHLHQQDWGIPVVLSPEGVSELVLNLGGDR